MRSLRIPALAVVVLLLGVLGAAAVTGERGDVNLNSIANEIGDAVLLCNFLIYGPQVWQPGMEGIQVSAADVDCDGISPTTADAVYLIGIITGWVLPCDGNAASRGASVTSDLDTLRVPDAAAGAGDTFFVEIYVRNVDSLGAYSLRLEYDPAVIEPLTDTTTVGPNTYVDIEREVMRGLSFEVLGGSVPQEGVLLWAASDFDYAASGAILPGGGAAVQLAWRVLPGAEDQTTPITLVNDPNYPESWNAFSDYHGAELVRPTLVDGAVTIGTGGSCDCPHQSDVNGDGFVDATDLAIAIDIYFYSAAWTQDPFCPTPRTDFDNSGFQDPVDLAKMIDHIFFGGAGPVDPCL
jgi:hypothetical protein